MPETRSVAASSAGDVGERTPRELFPPGKLSWIVAPLLGMTLVLAVIASLCIGAYPVSVAHAVRILAHLAWPGGALADPPWDLNELTVIEVIRLPRVLTATLAGIALGVCGTALQGMMRNPLVGPDFVGVNSGAACGGVLAVLLEWPPVGRVGLAFAGGLAAMAITFGLARLARRGTDGIAVILAGVFVGAFFVALIGLLQFVATDGKLQSMVYWMLGSFVGADRTKLATLAIPTVAAGAVLMGLRWRLNLLSLGDIDARSLGTDVTRLRWLIIVLVSVMVASQVAVSGIVGWVGLVVPHCARMLVGPDHRLLIPAAALSGGLFVLGLDDLTRSIVAAEIPVGALAALFGTPLVCLVFWKTQTRGWSRD